MAEVRNVFIKSKMNKDLDERLLPPGEYRDGQNISVNKSEGPDEGVVENIIGNNLYSNFNFGTGVEIIGTYVDTDKDRIFIFATNHSDSSPNQLDARAVGNVDTASGRFIQSAVCVIAYIEGPTASSGNVSKSDILVSGTFLNFSKTHPMLGIDIIEDLLFFTDNRNQPRKINVETAIADSATSPDPYYTNEDHISVSKLCPVSPINFIYEVGGAYISGLMDETSEYLPANSIGIFANSSSGAGTATMTANIPQLAASLNDKVRFKNISFPELGYFKMKTFTSNSPAEFTYEYPVDSGNNATQSYDSARAAAATFKGGTNTNPTRFPFVANDVLQFERENPVYNTSYAGDKDYLRNKFVRFSYRFKFDDGEYSLMAPFTQHAFVPKQYGYFLDSAVGDSKLKRDEKDTAESGVNKLMENQVTSAKFRLELPWRTDTIQSKLQFFKTDFKIESIQILLKESDGLAIKVVDEIEIDNAGAWYGSQTSTSAYFEYDYKSEKPFKVLPDADATRVHDKVPIRALAQAVTSNRVVYGNFIEKHESPESLAFDIGVTEKPASSSTSFDRKEYPNHTLKQNRSYKVGVVLVDRYGRSSNVILRDSLASVTPGDFASIYSPYANLTSTLNWPGNNLNLLFTSVISENKSTTGYPGVWSINNPLGFYSYKIVVQQKEQEYYNVYVPGACSGKITFKGILGSGTTTGDKPTYPRANTVSNIVLYGDNINKVPKELADVGPTEEVYGSETLLYPRVVTRYIVDSSNYPTSYKPVLSTTESSQIRELNEFNVTSIISFNDLGKWTGQNNAVGIGISSYPNDGTDYIDPLYLEASGNPFVAQLSTNFLVGFAPTVQEGTTPSTSPLFSKNLNVFETDPVTSEIDIYWESSTSDRIYILNNAIKTGTAGLPVGISEPNLVMSEAITPGVSSWVSDTFNVIDDTASPIIGATATMNVTNGNNANVSIFEMVESPAAPAYRIRYNPTDAGVYYGSDSNLRTFNFNITGTTSTGASNSSTNQMLLSNAEPSLTNIPISGYGGSPNSGSGVVMLFVGDNGATTGNSGSWDTPFSIQTTTLPNTGQGFPGCEVVRLNQYADVVNGSASTLSGVNQQEVSISNIAGSVNSQTLFIKTTSAPHAWWTITSNLSQLSTLLYTLGDPNPNIPGSAVNGKFLLKVNVVDAGGVGQGKTKTYSSWFQII
jgi:hypothetical protein